MTIELDNSKMPVALAGERSRSEGARLAGVQRARKVVLFAAVLTGLGALTVTRAEGLGPEAHQIIERIGWGLLGICILGRVWCSLYIGGRKVRDLVVHGPYSITRNPLYVFSFIGAAGVGASFGSLFASAILAFIAWAVFAVVVRKEEAALLKIHGAEYRSYSAATPRFLPNPGFWWDEDTLEVRPKRLIRTFFDGLVFLLAIPLVEGIQQLQNNGTLPVLLTAP